MSFIRRWIEERKKLYMTGVMDIKQEMKGYENKTIMPCDKYQ